MYTSNNNIPGSGVNFIAFNVPKKKAVALSSCIMTCMAHHAVSPGIGHGHKAIGTNMHFICKLVDADRKLELSKTYTTRTEPWTTLYELVPMFEYDDPNEWGALPKFPDPKKEKMMLAIIDKWAEYTTGNREWILSNPEIPNFMQAKPIDLAEALLHVGKPNNNDLKQKSSSNKKGSTGAGAGDDNDEDDDDDVWDVDWTVPLTKKEIALVKKHNEYFSNYAKIEYRKTRGCANCKKVWEPSLRLRYCSVCKQVMYCR